MARSAAAVVALESGSEFPFDAPDAWWHREDEPVPPPAKDWAHRAARGVLYNLSDRRGIKQGLQVLSIDEDTRIEIVDALAAIIREAARGKVE